MSLCNGDTPCPPPRPVWGSHDLDNSKGQKCPLPQESHWGTRVRGWGAGRWRAPPRGLQPGTACLLLCCVPWGSLLSLSEPAHTEERTPALWASVHVRWVRTRVPGPREETVFTFQGAWLLLPKPGALLWLTWKGRPQG